MATTELLATLEGVRRSGDGWKARCPAHEDNRASLSIGSGRDGRLLLKCHAGCETDAVARALGMELRDLFPEPHTTPTNGDRPQIAATYPYTDEAGALLFEAVRLQPKDFYQRRPDGRGGYVNNVKGVRVVPYQLPSVVRAVQAGRMVFVVEGEKDADRLAALGLVATCNAAGAGKWSKAHSEALKGARVVILPDNDDAGRQHVEDVARKLSGTAAEVRVVELPDLPPKGDVSDWLDTGATVERLKELVRAAPVWEPESNRVPESAPPALLLRPLGELLAEPEEEIEWIVRDLLSSGGVSLLVAKPKVGKSTLARTLAVAVAQGKPFLDRDVQQGTVVYLALEEKKSQLVKQFRALGATADDPILIFAGVAPKEAVALLRQAIIEHTPALVIVDTVQRLVRVRDGNDYSGVTSALEPILAMARELGAHLHLLHHAGKGERALIDAAIGSTAWAGTVDTAMQMKKREGVRTLATEQRYGEDLPETVLRMAEDGRIEASGTRQEHDRQQAAEAILDYLRENPGATKDKVREHVEGHRTATLQDALTELVKAKRVRREGEGKKGEPYTYFPMKDVPPEDSGSQNRENRISSSAGATSEASRIPVPTHRENSGNRNSEAPPTPDGYVRL